MTRKASGGHPLIDAELDDLWSEVYGDIYWVARPRDPGFAQRARRLAEQRLRQGYTVGRPPRRDRGRPSTRRKGKAGDGAKPLPFLYDPTQSLGPGVRGDATPRSRSSATAGGTSSSPRSRPRRSSTGPSPSGQQATTDGAQGREGRRPRRGRSRRTPTPTKNPSQRSLTRTRRPTRPAKRTSQRPRPLPSRQPDVRGLAACGLRELHPARPHPGPGRSRPSRSTRIS